MTKVHLTRQDIDYIARVVQTEVTWRDARRAGVPRPEYENMAKAVVDTIINRVASPHYPNTVIGVVDQDRQFTKIAGPKSYRTADGQTRRNDPYGTVQRAPKAQDETYNLVAGHIQARIAGAPSVVGGHLNYANAPLSSAVNQGWIARLDGPTFGRGSYAHRHGTASGNPVGAVQISADGNAIPSSSRPGIADVAPGQIPLPVPRPGQARAFESEGGPATIDRFVQTGGALPVPRDRPKAERAERRTDAVGLAGASRPTDGLAPPRLEAILPSAAGRAVRNLTRDIQYSNDANRLKEPFAGMVIHHSIPQSLDVIARITNTPRDEGIYLGYHFAIDRDGNIGQLAPLDQRVNHIGKNRSNNTALSNENSVAVSLLGVGSDPTPRQLEALRSLTQELVGRGVDLKPGNIAAHAKGQSIKPNDEGVFAANWLAADAQAFMPAQTSAAPRSDRPAAPPAGQLPVPVPRPNPIAATPDGRIPVPVSRPPTDPRRGRQTGGAGTQRDGARSDYAAPSLPPFPEPFFGIGREPAITPPLAPDTAAMPAMREPAYPPRQTDPVPQDRPVTNAGNLPVPRQRRPIPAVPTPQDRPASYVFDPPAPVPNRPLDLTDTPLTPAELAAAQPEPVSPWPNSGIIIERPDALYLDDPTAAAMQANREAGIGAMPGPMPDLPMSAPPMSALPMSALPMSALPLADQFNIMAAAPVMAPALPPPVTVALPPPVAGVSSSSPPPVSTPAPPPPPPTGMEVWQGRSDFGVTNAGYDGGPRFEMYRQADGDIHRYSQQFDRTDRIGADGSWRGTVGQGRITGPLDGGSTGSPDRDAQGGDNRLMDTLQRTAAGMAGGVAGSALGGPIGGILGAALGRELASGGDGPLSRALGGNRRQLIQRNRSDGTFTTRNGRSGIHDPRAYNRSIGQGRAWEDSGSTGRSQSRHIRDVPAREIPVPVSRPRR